MSGTVPRNCKQRALTREHITVSQKFYKADGDDEKIKLNGKISKL